MKNYKGYRHFIPIQLRFSDVDRLQHVNNACYLNFFELGRVTYFKDVLKENINWDKEGFILARTEINHTEPIYLYDDVYCCTKVVRLGNKSITIHNVILKIVNDKPVECAEGLGILVAMNYKTKKSKKLPATWKNLMEVYEKRN